MLSGLERKSQISLNCTKKDVRIMHPWHVEDAHFNFIEHEIKATRSIEIQISLIQR